MYDLPLDRRFAGAETSLEGIALRMSDHAYLPPSGASSWSKCAMWATMKQKYREESSSAADEGTAAHWVCWELVGNRPISPGMKAPNGVLVTDEMIEGAELLANTVRLRALVFGMDLHIEEKLQISSISPRMFGTPDCWALSTDSRHIEIFEYKFGFGFVDEFWNEQGLCYLAGVVDKLCDIWKIGPGMLDQFGMLEHSGMSVSFTVIQPRCFYSGSPVRTHDFQLCDARSHFNRLANMADAANLPQPTATTNPHCG